MVQPHMRRANCTPTRKHSPTRSTFTGSRGSISSESKTTRNLFKVQSTANRVAGAPQMMDIECRVAGINDAPPVEEF